MLGPRVEDAVVGHMSTNLHNLARGQFATLIGSVFVTSSGFIYVWLPGLICLLALAELFWRRPDPGLRARARRGDANCSGGGGGHPIRLGAGLGGACQRRRGDGYGAVAVLGALTVAIPASWRPEWIGCEMGLAVALLAAFAGDDFTSAGHLVALIIGMSLSVRFRVVARWTPMPLLAIGATFGYLVLANELPLALAPVAGLLGALIGRWATHRWRSRRLPLSASVAFASRLS